MKKRLSLLALALLVLMLPSCLGPAPGESAPASDSAPGSAESEPVSGTDPAEAGSGRLTPEGTFLPPEEWSGGELYPYPALYPYWITSSDGNGYASDYVLYGLADAEGRIVTDPYFSDFRAVTADDGTRLLFLAHDTEDPVEFLTAVYGPDSSRWPDGYDGSRAEFEMLAMAGDGSWRTPAVPQGGVLCYAGENRVVWQDPAEKSAVLYTTAGEKIALSREVSVDLYAGGSGGGGYHLLPLFSAGWLPVAVKDGSLGPYRNGYNFIDPDGSFLFAEDRSAVNNFDDQGYAAAFDPETGKCGIVDKTGAYTVKPTYEHPLIPAAAGAGLYAYAENGKNDYYKGILRADTGEILLPALFEDADSHRDETPLYCYFLDYDYPEHLPTFCNPVDRGEIWLTKDVNPYPYSLETGERIPFPAALKEEFGKYRYTPLARGWYSLQYEPPEGGRGLVLFRREDPENHIVIKETSFSVSAAYDPERDELVAFVGDPDEEEETVRAIAFDPASGERIAERDLDYFCRRKLEDGLYEALDRLSGVRRYIDLDFNEVFSSDFRRVTPVGNGLYAAETKDDCGLVRRDGSWVLKVPAAERLTLTREESEPGYDTDE